MKKILVSFLLLLALFIGWYSYQGYSDYVFRATGHSLSENKLINGSAVSQYNLGVRYEKGTHGKTIDYVKAKFWYEKAAEKNHGNALNNLANLYSSGKGVRQYSEKAEDLYKKSAAQGNAPAMFNLGVMYTQLKNYSQAIFWYEKAAEENLPEAEYNLGFMYKLGLGVDKNKSKLKSRLVGRVITDTKKVAVNTES